MPAPTWISRTSSEDHVPEEPAWVRWCQGRCLLSKWCQSWLDRDRPCSPCPKCSLRQWWLLLLPSEVLSVVFLPTTSMDPMSETPLRSWECRSPWFSSRCLNLNPLCSFRARSLWPLPCWLLLHHKSRSRCWENAFSLSSRTCIRIWPARSLACCLRSTTLSSSTCLSTRNPWRAR